MDEMISADDEGPCMGIELNVWERAKVGDIYYYYISYTDYLDYINYVI